MLRSTWMINSRARRLPKMTNRAMGGAGRAGGGARGGADAGASSDDDYA